MFLFFSSPTSSTMHSNLTDLASLLAFRSQLIDRGSLAGNWTSTTSFCIWSGVTCTSRMPHRVAALNVSGFSLQGTISPYLSNLSFMSLLDLSNNSLYSFIPDTLALLPRLSLLKLSYNELSGPIPPSIFNISSLVQISLARNNLSGYLPTISNHSTLPRLQVFSIRSNQLTGNIPFIFSRCPALQTLSLLDNQFIGTIPVNLPQGLSILYLGYNNLTGAIPRTLSNLTLLTELSLDFNGLTGMINPLSYLPNLRNLWVSNNRLTGTIPASFANSSMLNILEISKNNLVGAVPPDIFTNMPHLTVLNLGRNQLTDTLDFLTPLTNSRALEYLELIENKFEGVIPSSIGNLSSQLMLFNIYSNPIEGRIPYGFGNLTKLLRLDLSENKLQGAIPNDITRLEFLQTLFFENNNLDGCIPRELGQLRSLGQLYFSANNLSGSIPDTLSNLSSLLQLDLSGNSLTSTIPDTLWSLQELTYLDFSHNLLTGNLDHLGRLELPLYWLDLSSNRFSGSIPSALGESIRMLEYLDLSYNSLRGSVPHSLSKLISLNVLNLSSNSLSGQIPKSLADLRYLVALNLSFNKLEGQIPDQGVFHNLTFQSLIGNLALCGMPRLGFPPCSSLNATAHHSRLLNIVLVIVASSIAVVVGVVVLCVILTRKNGVLNNALIISKPLADQRFISYQELIRATDNFNEANLLGRGSSGSVFKGYLDDGMVVAVKVLNLEIEGASDSFEAECHALCMARHRNLVKIISTCSNLDFKALILHFMPNGSLEICLYSSVNRLTLAQRISIMLDVAHALEYLHDHHIVHCDLKPSNVLLDEEMTAHVGDFGIAKLMLSGKDHSKSSIVSASVPGTIGYMAPEYGLAGRVSRKADVYSYGILLLETITRRRPTDAMFNEDSSLRQWVYKSYPKSILEIADKELLTIIEDKENNSNTRPQLQCLESLLELGLSCSEELPIQRIAMKEVVARLTKIRSDYLSSLT